MIADGGRKARQWNHTMNPCHMKMGNSLLCLLLTLYFSFVQGQTPCDIRHCQQIEGNTTCSPICVSRNYTRCPVGSHGPTDVNFWELEQCECNSTYWGKNFDAEVVTTLDSSVQNPDTVLWFRIKGLPHFRLSGELQLTWTDQGVGNRRGMIEGRMNGSNAWTQITGNPPRPSGPETFPIPQAVFDTGKAGSVLEIGYRVGGGGGFRLTIQVIPVLLRASVSGSWTTMSLRMSP